MSDLALDFVIGLATIAAVIVIVAVVLVVWGPDPRGHDPRDPEDR